MKYLTLAALGATAIAAGCSSNGDDNGGIATNALGYYGDVNWDTAMVEGSGTAAANLNINDDDSVTVQITDGPDAGESATFYRDGYGGYYSDDVDAYLELGYFDDPNIKDGPVVALIDVDRSEEELTYMAFRSTDGMTAVSDMPVTGAATYTGSHAGGAAKPYDYSLLAPSGSYLDYISGGFQANVDFGAGQLDGTMQSQIGSVTFDGAISGAEFKSNQIALDGDTGVVDQGASGVEGGFYGSGAAGMAGTYLLNGQGSLDGAGAVGAFSAERN